jgi:asparagine synthase (glutamine-hydrolysing)
MIDRYARRYRRDLFADNATYCADIGNETMDIAVLSALADAQTYLPDDILVKVDRAAMSASLETRAPFLDHRMVEFALKLPLQYRMSGRLGKLVLRRALERRVPPSFLSARKQGFSVPIARWLRQELRGWAEDMLKLLPDADGLVDRSRVTAAWGRHLSGLDHAEPLWAVLMLLQFIGRQRRVASA